MLGVGTAQKPGLLREFAFELALGPSGIPDECAHRCGRIFQDLLGLGNQEVMLAFHALGLRVPAERGKNQLILLHRTAQENGDPGQFAQRFVWEYIADKPAGGLLPSDILNHE